MKLTQLPQLFLNLRLRKWVNIHREGTTTYSQETGADPGGVQSGGSEAAERLEVQRSGPRPGSLKPSPFAYLSGSGGGAAAPGYPRGAAWNWDLRRADPQETTSAPGPPRAASVGSVVRETARSMLGSRGGGREPSRGGSVLELHWAGKGGRPRGSRCSHLTAAASERTGRPSSGTSRPAPAPLRSPALLAPRTRAPQ